jgi:predicted phage gp36 major capsid-like protein
LSDAHVFPVVEAEDMPGVAANSLSIAFGDPRLVGKIDEPRAIHA